MLADKQIEAIYNPLPNDLHVPWTIAAAESGKHVLCEKPIAMNAGEAMSLIECRDQTGVLIQEAFMVRTHPQWLGVRESIASGNIGQLRAITGFFSYFNRDPDNIRNKTESGGGALMDIGCYPITISRFILGEEPKQVLALVDRDPEMRVDRLTSAILDFPSCQSTFTCSTQLISYQHMHFLGTSGHIGVEIPFNAPADRPARTVFNDGRDHLGTGAKINEFPICNQYTIQGDLFSQAIRNGTPAPIPLEDAISNMKVIDALFRSAETGKWETT